MGLSASHPPLIAALLRADAYPHPVTTITLVETHISWVLLTGTYAYKIKKPVRFSFLDFSTLLLRYNACQEEIRLNRRYAPQIYEQVIPICGNQNQPRVNGSGPAIEYAVCMRQFSQQAQLDHLLATGRLRGETLETFGTRLAQLYELAPAAAAHSIFGTPAKVQAAVHENFAEMLADSSEPHRHDRLKKLQAWSLSREADLTTLFERRRQTGRIRECHGDLHLGNLVQLEGEIIPFDCIEFSEDLRWNDVISDIAFLVMDLLFHRQPVLAYRFLNAYLEASGDYEGVPLLNYYLIYRALVRAKIAAIRANDLPPKERDGHLDAACAHIELADSIAFGPKPLLILMHGMSGSGKSWISRSLAPELPAIRIRSDVERKRLHGMTVDARSGSGVASGIYTADSSARTYAYLAALTRAVLGSGQSVVLDACFLARQQRDQFWNIAKELAAPCILLDCRAPQAVLESRLLTRARSQHDASEADHSVLAHQRTSADPLSALELTSTIPVDTTVFIDTRSLAERIRRDSESRANPDIQI